MKNRTWLAILGLVMTALGCSLTFDTPATPTHPEELGTPLATTIAPASTATPVEAAATQAVTSPAPTEEGETPVSFENISFVIPHGVASGANTEKMTAVETNSGAPWEIAPTHWRFSLTGYALQGKFHEPRIFVYPAEEYAKVNPGAAMQIESLKRIRAGSPILRETMPRVPWFNADLLIAANNQIIEFQNGSGVRTLTEYAQYYAPINNNELIYHFQGLTEDDKYYVFAILPITAPILAENEKADASVPEGGVPIPTDIGVSNNYYVAVTEKLNSLSPEAFTPALGALDELVQSLLVK